MMKLINPIAREQLAKWKANHRQSKINRFIDEMNRFDNKTVRAAKQSKNGAVKNTGADFTQKGKSNLPEKGKVYQNGKGLTKTVNNPLKNEPVKNPQSDAHSEPKTQSKGKLGFNPLSLKLTQFNRQFELIKASNAKCFLEFPDCYHHKLKFSAECEMLVESLQAGKALLSHFTAGQTLTEQQRRDLRHFNQMARYLLTKLNELIQNVADIPRMSEEELNAMRFSTLVDSNTKNLEKIDRTLLAGNVGGNDD